MNQGERDELIAKLYLVYLRDNCPQSQIGNVFSSIKSVGFPDAYLPLKVNINLDKFNQMTDSQLKSLSMESQIDKSPTRAKADVYLNGIGCSLKSTRCSPPAIVNHTNRIGFLRICNEIGLNIDCLDNIVAKYWSLRMSGVIKEDIHNNDPNSPFKDHRQYLGPILEYFLFTGTGSAVSSHPATYMISFTDPLDLTTWEVFDKNGAVDQIWYKLVFSLRSKKGMPPFYPTGNPQKDSVIGVWAKLWQGQYRGSLHIRTT